MVMVPDDLRPGQLVTVLRWHDPKPEIDFDGPVAVIQPRPERRTAGMGHVYRIVAVSLPYVAAQDYQGAVVFFDTRELELAPVSRRYAEAVLRALERRMKQARGKQVHGLATLLGMGGNET